MTDDQSKRHDPPTSPHEVADIYERAFLEWVCARQYEDIRGKWSQIEGVHQRAGYTLTAVLAFAAFAATNLAPLGGGMAVGIGMAVGLPLLLGVVFVLMPRVGCEARPDMLWDATRREFEPDANLDTLADHLRLVVDSRKAELDSKGRWLVATQAVALLGILVMLFMIATKEASDTDGRKAETHPQAPGSGH